MQEIMVLILEIVLLIIKTGISKEEAVRKTANKYGVDYMDLWESVRRHWK